MNDPRAAHRAPAITGKSRPDAAARPSPPCARCGRDADYDFGPIWLCLDCYHVAGSTCAGIGRPATPPDPVC